MLISGSGLSSSVPRTAGSRGLALSLLNPRTLFLGVALLVAGGIFAPPALAQGCFGTPGGAPVRYEGGAEAKASSNVLSIDVPIPCGTSNGDLLVVAVATDGNTAASISPPGGEGWTLIDVGAYNNEVTLAVWWKLAGASESATHQFTWSGTQQVYAWMMRFTGHDAAAPIHVVAAAEDGNNSTPTSPAVTTTVDNTLIVRMGAFDEDDVTIDSPGLSGHTAITMDESDPASGTVSGGAGYVVQATAGSSGTSTFSLTDTEQSRTVTIAIAPVQPVAFTVTPDGADTLGLLPSNGTATSYKFTVTNSSGAVQSFDLFGYSATILTTDSVTGPNVTRGADPDSARIADIPASSSDSAFVWFQVSDAALGTLDSLYLMGRAVSNSNSTDSGSAFVELVKPSMTTSKSVNPNGTQLPGTDLTYTVTVTNDGSQDAAGVVIVDSLPAEVEFKVGSVVNNLPVGIGVTVEYSNDGGSSWTYVPISTGCGAPANYDGCVDRIRWTLLNVLGFSAPDNTGTVEFVCRIS